MAEFLIPVPKLVYEDQVAAAGCSLEQLGAHGHFGGDPAGLPRTGKASRTRAAVFGWSSV
ncbi:hypothetical protein [Streptomyces herbicida]|uniref:hypothetical protein n=1 Tax=Streptomyces herbicida TaxID=3065675 RepID=UPI002930BA65|nr:hypothetical protein [Streptomyces sp. NEAU-HV9]